MSSTTIARLLIVDDESAHMQALCDILTVEGYFTVGVGSGLHALSLLREQDFDLLLTDLMMPEMNGITLLSAAHALAPDLVAIVMTGHAAIDTAVKAMQAGALDYIVKPFKVHAILPVLNRALAVRQLRIANRQLEARVHLRTRELETANRQLEAVNRELESFSYSVSHDLRAPLRAVHGYCQIYLEDFGSKTPAEGLPLLNQVQAAALRMGQLIDDLLRLSQLGRQPIRRSVVPLADLARRVAGELKADEAQRSLEIHVGDLGVCDGDASLLEQVMRNLLSNAFKFTRERSPALIEVDCRSEAQEKLYFVRDNGAGFDMKYASKLFGAFQRLHSDSQFEGTGVGLSIVQRIIQRHGGRIWAESAAGEGATFYFTIPPSA
jgi:two-component system sensor histidine kinase/response regulator